LIRLTLGNFDYANGGFKLNTSKDNLYYSGPVADNFILNEGDIITPMTEQTPGLLGSTARIPESGKYIQSQDVGLVTCDEEMIDKDFCYYLLPSEIVKKQLAAGAQQTKIRHTSPDKIEACTVFIPKPNEQRKIGKLLSTIDKLIELKRKENALLESMARQIYDYWFVQFDFPNKDGNPYKSSGGKMVWNEKLKRDIPDGWGVGLIKQFIQPIERGVSYSTQDIADNTGCPMINLACYTKKGDYRWGKLKFFTGEVKDCDKVLPYDMLVACTDMTQGADIIGIPILVTEEYKWFVYSMDLAKITPIDIDKYYLYYSLRTPFYHNYIKPFASGTNVKHLDIKGVENYMLVNPVENIQKCFGSIIAEIKKKQMNTLNETNELQSLRDYLLPLLMTGQVTIKD